MRIHPITTKVTYSLLITFAVCAVMVINAQPPASPVLDAMKTELARSQEKLKSQPTPPYFISYEIAEEHSLYVSGEFGRVTASSEGRHRVLNTQVRVGDYKLDNTHEIRGEFNGMTFNGGPAPIPLDNDVDAVRAVLWYQTDQHYKRAIEQFTKVKTNVKVKVAQEDDSGDFTREEPQHYSEAITDIKLDKKVWEEKIRKYSAPFAAYTNIYQAQAFLQASNETRWYVNSEGSVIQTSQPAIHLFIYANTKASDGMELPRYESYFGFSEKDLPDDATVLKDVNQLIHDMEALRVAPVVEPYTGPAILSGRASGVFFHEIFGHRVEGARQRNSDDAQTFKKKLGQQVLSKDFSVYFDPTMRRLGNTELAGYYTYDNEGVKARRVAVVENGTLKTFLMSRKPVEGVSQSNGHGRGQIGLAPVARQSNLIVEVAPSAVQPDLKKPHGSQRIQCASAHGLPHLPRRPSGVSARCGSHRHAADHVQQDFGG
jgi:TldD protein